jgi:hypothetical protein
VACCSGVRCDAVLGQISHELGCERFEARIPLRNLGGRFGFGSTWAVDRGARVDLLLSQVFEPVPEVKRRQAIVAVVRLHDVA